MCYLGALQNIGITQNNTEEITEFETNHVLQTPFIEIGHDIQGIPDLT